MSGFIHAEITIKTRNPRSHEAPIAPIIPRGTALAALCAEEALVFYVLMGVQMCVPSSDICTQESKSPMVQIGDIQANIKAQPVGQVVKFSV
jgi:hypothetical protein